MSPEVGKLVVYRDRERALADLGLAPEVDSRTLRVLSSELPLCAMSDSR